MISVRHVMNFREKDISLLDPGLRLLLGHKDK